MTTFNIKQGDTTPILVATLYEQNDEPVDLSDATVRIQLEEPRGGETILDTEATSTNSDGVVQYSWQEGDTDQYGRFRCEFEVTFPNGKVETFPNSGYNSVIIERSLADG